MAKEDNLKLLSGVIEKLKKILKENEQQLTERKKSIPKDLEERIKVDFLNYWQEKGIEFMKNSIKLGEEALKEKSDESYANWVSSYISNFCPWNTLDIKESIKWNYKHSKEVFKEGFIAGSNFILDKEKEKSK